MGAEMQYCSNCGKQTLHINGICAKCNNVKKGVLVWVARNIIQWKKR